MPQNKFSVYEIVQGSLSNRGNFQSSDSNLTELSGKSECYRSVFLHPDEIIKYYKENRTISGYKKSVGADEFILDFDSDNLSEAHESLKKFLQHIQSTYELDLDYLRINLSGSKGFHVRFPAVLFGGFEPSTTLHQLHQQIALKLSNGIDEIDTGIYKITGLIRIPNTFNSKGKRYAIPLEAKEVIKMSIDEILSMAENPRDNFEYIEVEELGENNFLVELKEETAQEIKKSYNTSPKSSTYRSKSTTKLFDPAVKGTRQNQLVSLVGKLIRKGFAENEIYQMVKLWNSNNQPPLEEQHIEYHVNDLLQRYGNTNGKYWQINDDGKVDMKQRDLLKHLVDKGFSKVYYGTHYQFIRNKGMIIDEYSFVQIKDFILDELRTINISDKEKEMVEEYLYNYNGKYLGERFIENISYTEVDPKRDEKDSAYLFYNNGIIKIENGRPIGTLDYKELNSPVWRNHIIDRDFKPIEHKTQLSEYEQFIWNVSGKNEDRFLSFCTAIGYLLHSYKNRAEAKVVVLNDEIISESPNGRTGKSLFGVALGEIRKSNRIDARNFQFTDRFTFQQISVSDQLIEFNDAKKDFPFDRLFSVVTDDMTIEYKSEKPFHIPFDKSPKFLISTNYSINGSGDSYKDRMFELEFANYYTAKFKPVDEFGHMFFYDWDEEEWNRFDNFMVECIQLYLEYGLYNYKKVNLDTKKIINATDPDFYEFVEDTIFPNQEYEKNEVYKLFCDHLGYSRGLIDKVEIKQHRFTKYLKIYCNYKGYTYYDRPSNGKYYFTLKSV